MENRICSYCGASSFYKRTLKYSMEKHAIQYNCRKCKSWFIENEILVNNEKIKFIQPGNRKQPPESFERENIPNFFTNRLARKISERYLARSEREEDYSPEYQEEDEDENYEDEDCEEDDEESNIGRLRQAIRTLEWNITSGLPQEIVEEDNTSIRNAPANWEIIRPDMNNVRRGIEQEIYTRSLIEDLTFTCSVVNRNTNGTQE